MDVVIRPLQESDIPTIIEFTKNVWGGHDHLPKLIHSWLSDSDSHPMVMDYGDEVVAVANLRSVDDKLTGWMEGLRVHPDLREKGLAKLMTVKLVELASEKQFERIRLVTSADNPAPQKLAQSVGMMAIDSFSVFWKRYGQSVKWIKNNESITSVSASQVKQFIHSNPILFPSTSLIYHWDVFDSTKSNIDALCERATFSIYEGEKGKGLTMGFVNEIPPEPEWCFSVYASNTQVFKLLIDFQLKQAREQGLRQLLCMHQPQYKSLYGEIRWLKTRSHELGLLLFERIL